MTKEGTKRVNIQKTLQILQSPKTTKFGRKGEIRTGRRDSRDPLAVEAPVLLPSLF